MIIVIDKNNSKITNVMRRIINPFIILYHISVFIPIAIVTTIICATATCVMIPIWGDKRWGYYPGMIWAKILCTTALVRVRAEGREHVSPDSTYVFTANHQSIFDVFLVYGWLGTKFRWVMKKEIRHIPFIGKACEMMGHIFIDRSNAVAAKKSIEAAERRLKSGGSIFIFPEGTRTKDGAVGKFKRGAFVMARDLQLPVVPATIAGAYEVMPYHSWLIHPGTIRLIIHHPIEASLMDEERMNLTIAQIRNTIASSL